MLPGGDQEIGTDESMAESHHVDNEDTSTCEMSDTNNSSLPLDSKDIEMEPDVTNTSNETPAKTETGSDLQTPVEPDATITDGTEDNKTLAKTETGKDLQTPVKTHVTIIDGTENNEIAPDLSVNSKSENIQTDNNITKQDVVLKL